MKAVTVKARDFVPKGRVYLMPNTDHPEVDLWLTIDEAEHLLVVCHPDHEQVVRDAIAIEQERPAWWRDTRAIEAAIEQAGERRGGAA